MKPCRFIGRQVSQLEARLSEAKAKTRRSLPSAEVEKDEAVSRMALLQDILVRSLATRTSDIAAPSARSCSAILLVRGAVMVRDESHWAARDDERGMPRPPWRHGRVKILRSSALMEGPSSAGTKTLVIVSSMVRSSGLIQAHLEEDEQSRKS